jgi:hypothetical protein
MPTVLTALIVAFILWSAYEDVQRANGATLVSEIEQFLAEVLA